LTSDQIRKRRESLERIIHNLQQALSGVKVQLNDLQVECGLAGHPNFRIHSTGPGELDATNHYCPDCEATW
jgi:hypothetical protein